MAKVDLHNFFKFYDEKNPNHVKAVQWLEDHLPVKFLEDHSEWIEFYRGKTQSKITNIVEYDVPEPGIALIKEFEGCRLKAYPDPLTGGQPITIGWGSTRKKDGTAFKLGDTITQKEADDLLVEECRRNIMPSLSKISYWNDMNLNQKGALLSFAYNLGAGFYGADNFETITRVLKNKQWDLVPDSLYLYRNTGSNVEAGLARRRKAEGQLWKKI